MQHQCWGRSTANQRQHWHIRNIYQDGCHGLNFEHVCARAQFISTFSTENRLLAHQIICSKVITALILRSKSFFSDFLFFILMQYQCWGRSTANQRQHWHIRNIYDRFRFKLNFQMAFDNAHGSINVYIFRLSSPYFTVQLYYLVLDWNKNIIFFVQLDDHCLNARVLPKNMAVSRCHTVTCVE